MVTFSLSNLVPASHSQRLGRGRRGERSNKSKHRVKNSSNYRIKKKMEPVTPSSSSKREVDSQNRNIKMEAEDGFDESDNDQNFEDEEEEEEEEEEDSNSDYLEPEVKMEAEDIETSNAESMKTNTENLIKLIQRLDPMIEWNKLALILVKKLSLQDFLTMKAR
jgi:hypothetical protein